MNGRMNVSCVCNNSVWPKSTLYNYYTITIFSVEKINQFAAEPSTDNHYIAYIGMDNLENKST